MGGKKKGTAPSEDKSQDLVPTLLPMVQKKLNDLVGATSGYLESLPKNVQNRVRALKKLQKEKEAVDDEYKKEKEALEQKFKEKFAPFYNKRSEIVNGVVEPEWIEPEPVEGEKKDEAKTESKNEGKEEAKADESVKGIPEFWLVALKHHQDIGDLISERDEDALKFLKDVTVKPVPEDKHSFTLEFTFAENPFFENTVLSKTYHLFEHPAYGEIMFDRIETSEVKWKSGKNLTVRTVTKSQGGRGGRRGGKRGGGPAKSVTIEQPAQSFFNFFKPDSMLIVPEEDEEEMEDEELEGMLEFDYEIGTIMKDVLIPNALKWFTGEAVQGMDAFDDEEGETDDEEGDDDEDDEEDDEEGQAPATGAPGGEAKPECKQQ